MADTTTTVSVVPRRFNQKHVSVPSSSSVKSVSAPATPISTEDGDVPPMSLDTSKSQEGSNSSIHSCQCREDARKPSGKSWADMVEEEEEVELEEREGPSKIKDIETGKLSEEDTETPNETEAQPVAESLAEDRDIETDFVSKESHPIEVEVPGAEESLAENMDTDTDLVEVPSAGKSPAKNTDIETEIASTEPFPEFEDPTVEESPNESEDTETMQPGEVDSVAEESLSQSREIIPGPSQQANEETEEVAATPAPAPLEPASNSQEAEERELAQEMEEAETRVRWEVKAAVDDFIDQFFNAWEPVPGWKYTIRGTNIISTRDAGPRRMSYRFDIHVGHNVPNLINYLSERPLSPPISPTAPNVGQQSIAQWLTQINNFGEQPTSQAESLEVSDTDEGSVSQSVPEEGHATEQPKSLAKPLEVSDTDDGSVSQSVPEEGHATEQPKSLAKPLEVTDTDERPVYQSVPEKGYVAEKPTTNQVKSVNVANINEDSFPQYGFVKDYATLHPTNQLFLDIPDKDQEPISQPRPGEWTDVVSPRKSKKAKDISSSTSAEDTTAAPITTSNQHAQSKSNAKRRNKRQQKSVAKRAAEEEKVQEVNEAERVEEGQEPEQNVEEALSEGVLKLEQVAEKAETSIPGRLMALFICAAFCFFLILLNVWTGDSTVQLV